MVKIIIHLFVCILFFKQLWSAEERPGLQDLLIVGERPPTIERKIPKKRKKLPRSRLKPRTLNQRSIPTILSEQVDPPPKKKPVDEESLDRLFEHLKSSKVVAHVLTDATGKILRKNNLFCKLVSPLEPVYIHELEVREGEHLDHFTTPKGEVIPIETEIIKIKGSENLHYQITPLTLHELCYRQAEMLGSMIPKATLDLYFDSKFSGKGKKPANIRYESVSVMFADLVGSTAKTAGLSPRAAFALLNAMFRPFDMAIRKRIDAGTVKLIGDCHMSYFGVDDTTGKTIDYSERRTSIPQSNSDVEPKQLRPCMRMHSNLGDFRPEGSGSATRERSNSFVTDAEEKGFTTYSHADTAILTAIDFLRALKKHNDSPSHGTDLNVRIGINSGPIIAGIVGTDKPQYDINGPTVSLAKRMEENGESSRILITQETYVMLDKKMQKLFMDAKTIPVKGYHEEVVVYQSKSLEEMELTLAQYCLHSSPAHIGSSSK